MPNNTQPEPVLDDNVEKLFFRIFDQEKFPTLKGDYKAYLAFKESTCKIIGEELATAVQKERERIIEWLGDGVMDVYLGVKGLEQATGVDKKGVVYRLIAMDLQALTAREEGTE